MEKTYSVYSTTTESTLYTGSDIDIAMDTVRGKEELGQVIVRHFEKKGDEISLTSEERWYKGSFIDHNNRSDIILRKGDLEAISSMLD